MYNTYSVVIRLSLNPNPCSLRELTLEAFHKLRTPSTITTYIAGRRFRI